MSAVQPGAGVEDQSSLFVGRIEKTPRCRARCRRPSRPLQGRGARSIGMHMDLTDSNLDGIAALGEPLTSLVRAVRGLRLGLVRYARHEEGCSQTDGADAPCTCGLAELLATT